MVSRKVLLLMILLFSSIFSVQPAISENNEEVEPFEVKYQVVDTLADGTEIVRGEYSTLDPFNRDSLRNDQTYEHPLSSDRIALVGGEEILISTWREDPVTEFEGEMYFGFVSNKSDSEIPFNETLGDAAEDDHLYSADEGFLPMRLAVGDFDDNYQQDIMGVFTSSNEAAFEKGIQIRIWERWLDQTNLLISENYDFGIGGSQAIEGQIRQLPQVVEAQLDDDDAFEFIISGLDNGAQTIYVFDDLMGSRQTGEIQYGQEIAIRTSNHHNDYFKATDTDIVIDEINGMYEAPTDYRFTIVHPNGTSSDNIQYDDEFVLQSPNGKYVSVDNTTGEVSLIDVSGNFSNAEIFSLSSNKQTYSIDGDFFSNSFASFKSKTGGLLRYSGSDVIANPGVAGDLAFTFKISNASAIPFNFNSNSAQLLTKITDTDYSYIAQHYDTEAISQYGLETIRAANLDNDPQDEFVFLGLDSSGNSIGWVYDDALTNFNELHEFSWTYTDRNPSLAMGDTDGDGRSEIIISQSSADEGSIFVYDDAVNNFNQLKVLVEDDADFGEISPRLYTHDTNADKKHEIYYHNYEFSVTAWSDHSGNYEIINEFDIHTDSGTSSKPTIQFGDIDHDSYDEMLTAYVVDGARQAFKLYEYEDSNFTEVDYYLGSIETTTTVDMAMGDVNGDQFTLEFLNEIDEFQTPGEISVVAAAPPNQAGISQNYPATGTTFGEGTSSGEGEGSSVASSYGYYMQAEAGFDIGFLSVGGSASRKVTEEFSRTETVVSTRTDNYEFTGGSNDDFVLYTTTIYDTYTYQILEAVNPRLEGRNLTLNVPREPRLYQQTKEFYNKNNNDGDLDIGNNIFSHTPGHVPSYLTRDELQPARNSILYSQELAVGQGGGSQSVSIELSTEKTVEFESSTTTEWEAGGSVTVFGVGGGGGGTWTSSEGDIHSTSVGESTTFQASVGSIEDEQEYQDFRYAYGMAVYLHEELFLGVTRGFYVINFWVDLPLNWGGESVTQAEDARDVASGIDNLASELPLDMVLVMSTIVAIPIIRRRKL